MPDLSVCITTYNLYDYIDEALESVMNQKTRYSVEILIGDDGSTDGTIEKIMQWQAKYPGLIKYYQMERDIKKKYNFIYRASQNRINLKKHARGKYINFMDGDDLYKTEYFFEKAINILEDPDNLDCIGCGGKTEMFYPDGKTQQLGTIPVGKITLSEYWKCCYTHSEAVVYRNIIDVDIRYVDYFDDNLIMFFALQKGLLYCMSEAVVAYRQKEGAYFTRPILERNLYEIIDYDVECSIAPQLQPVIAERHMSNLYAVHNNMSDVTIEKFPTIYQMAVDMRSNTLIKIFESNIEKSKIESRKNIFIKKIINSFSQQMQIPKYDYSYALEVPLNEMKKIELEGLIYFRNFCKRYDLKYFLAYGTLLGAVRHKGFIPWDDDIDVWMLREDFDKLMLLSEKINNDSWELQSIYNNKGYYFSIAKLCNKKTLRIPSEFLSGILFGVYIDIFILDNCPYVDKIDYESQQKVIEISDNMLLDKIKEYSSWTHANGSYINDENKAAAICNFINAEAKYGDFNKLLLERDNLLRALKNKRSEFYWDADIVGFYNAIYKKEWFEDSVMLKFEGEEFSCPKNYKEILKNIYGNYMQLPPKEKRVSNHRIFRTIYNGS